MKNYSHIISRPSIGMAAALVASISFAGSARASFSGPGTYRIEVADTQQVLDIEWNSMNPGAHVLRWGPNPGANQKFIVLQSTGGRFVIKAVSSLLCLNLPGGSTQRGIQPVQSKCVNKDRQRFYIDAAGNGLSKIRTANNNMIFFAKDDMGRVELASNPRDTTVGMLFRFKKI